MLRAESPQPPFKEGGLTLQASGRRFLFALEAALTLTDTDMTTPLP